MKISFILPATDKKQVLRLEKSLNALGQPFEIIPIYGATSFFDCWRKAMPKAKGEYLILTHQDTEFHYIPKLNVEGLAGVAGAKEYNIDDPWWFTRDRYINSRLSGQIYHDKQTKGLSNFGPYGDVEVLDGVCLVTKPEILKKVLKDLPDVTWDWYDHVLSKAYLNAGYQVKTIPILMTHYSAGGERRKTFEKERKVYVKWYKNS